MTTPIPNCPQEDKPIRDRAWTDEQITAAARALWNARSHTMMQRAGYPTEWEKITRTLQKEYIREARTALNATIGATP